MRDSRSKAQSSELSSEIPPLGLLPLDGLEQRLEVPLPEALRAPPLDDLVEERTRGGVIVDDPESLTRYAIHDLVRLADAARARHLGLRSVMEQALAAEIQMVMQDEAKFVVYEDVGLFNAVVNLTLILAANYAGKRITQVGLW